MVGRTRYALGMTGIAAALAALPLAGTPACARGGAAANIMSSPGYQRALTESRKPTTTSATTTSSQAPSVPRRHRKH